MKKFLEVLLAISMSLWVGACSNATPAAEPLVIRIAYSNAADVADLPSLMAQVPLTAQGYTVQPTFYSSVELAVEALAQGEADIATGSARAYWLAISQGAPLITILAHARNEWTLVSQPSIIACADLDGKRIAVNSEGSISTVMTKAYIQENCPSIHPEYLTIAGSENRAAALLTGEVQAAPIEVADVVQLTIQNPAQFHTLISFAETLPNLHTTLVYAHQDFATQHPQAVRDYIRATLQTYRAVYENSLPLQAEISERLEIDETILPKVLEADLALKLWDVNGGLTPETVKYTLDFLTASGNLDAGVTADQVVDLAFLNAVLDEIGRK